MRRKKPHEVPARLARLEQRLAAWRKTRTLGERIPRSLWKSAAKLASEYGLSRTSSLLKLSYTDLRNHVERHRADTSSSGPFVELSTSSFPLASESMIELEDGAGAIMRIHLKGTEVPDVLALGNSFWNAK